MFIYFWKRETKHQQWGGGAEKEGDTESEAGSRLQVVSTESNAGLELTSCEILTWAEDRRSTDWDTQIPFKLILESKDVFKTKEEISKK